MIPRALVPCLFLLWTLSVPARAQFTVPQHTGATAASSPLWTLEQNPFGNATNEAGTCGSAVATTCVIPLTQPVAAGDTLIFWAATQNSVTISSISAGGTFVHCSNCAQTSGLLDGGYVLVATAATTSITVTFSGATGGGDAGVYDWKWSGSTVTFDSSGGTPVTSSGASTFPGQTLTLSGSHDAILQAGVAAQIVSSVSSPYGNTVFDSGGIFGWGLADSLNTTSGAAPTWTASGAVDAYASFAIALKGS